MTVETKLPLRAAEFAHPRDDHGWNLFRGETLVATGLIEAEAKGAVVAVNTFEPMRRAIADALEWYGRPDESALERFERHAHQFYIGCGMLAPGKSEPMEVMGVSEERDLERWKLWRAWCAERTNAVNAALAAALRAADGEAP